MILSASHATGLDTEGRTWAIDPELDKEESSGMLSFNVYNPALLTIEQLRLTFVAVNKAVGDLNETRLDWDGIDIEDVCYSDAILIVRNVREEIAHKVPLRGGFKIVWVSYGMLYNGIDPFTIGWSA